MDDPGLRQAAFGDGEVRAFVGERRLELARTSLARALTGKRKVLRAGANHGHRRNAAAGDKAMDVGMEDELLGPGVEHGENADGAPTKRRSRASSMMASAAAV